MAYPNGTLVTDIVIQTKHGERKSRFYWISDTAPPTVAEVEGIANTVKNTFQAQLTALMPVGYHFTRVDARYYSGSNDLEAPSNTAGANGLIAVAGTAAVDPMPDEAALILRIQTGKIGRSKRGRRFIAGLSEAINDAGQVATGHRANCVNLATKVAQDIEVLLNEEGDSWSTMLHARHYDRKNNVLEPITKCWALQTIGTRRDRRKPLKLVPITVTA